MLILNKNDIIQHVDLNKNLIPIIEEAFKSLSKGLVMMPPIMRIDIEKYHGESDVKAAYVDDFVLVSEEKIAEGIRINFLEHKIVSEGAAATSVMGVKEKLTSHLGKNIICLICGGNIDSELFNKVLSHAHP